MAISLEYAYHSAFKYVVCSLVPALPQFRVHQWIASSDTFGEYYAFGFKAYLLGFAVNWGAMIVYMVIWAAMSLVGAPQNGNYRDRE